MRLLSRGVARAAVCGRLLVGGGRLERQGRGEAGVRLNLWGGGRGVDDPHCVPGTL